MNNDEVTKSNYADIFLRLNYTLDKFLDDLREEYNIYTSLVYQKICTMSFLHCSTWQGGICTTIWTNDKLAKYARIGNSNVEKAMRTLKEAGHIKHRKIFFADTLAERQKFDNHRRRCFEKAYRDEEPEIIEEFMEKKIRHNKPTEKDIIKYNLDSDKYFVVDYYTIEFYFYPKHYKTLEQSWDFIDGFVVTGKEGLFDFSSKIMDIAKMAQNADRKDIKEAELLLLLSEEFSTEDCEDIIVEGEDMDEEDIIVEDNDTYLKGSGIFV